MLEVHTKSLSDKPIPESERCGTIASVVAAHHARALRRALHQRRTPTAGSKAALN